MPAPSPVVPTSSRAENAETSALISQIASEARSAGKSLTFNPDTGVDAADESEGESDDGAEASKPGRGKDGKFTKPAKGAKLAKEAEEEAESDDAKTEETEETEETEGDEETDETDETPGEIDRDAVRAALDAEGGVDMLALAKALGKKPEELGVTPAQHLALRVGQRKAKATLKQAEKLADSLMEQYGDRVKARRAVEVGDLNPAIECVEAIFGMPWNELNRAVAAGLAGKPLPDIESKRELRELKKRELERAEADKKTKEEAATAERTAQAKTFITTKIKGDKLATPEVTKFLKDAGLPPIVDLVFDELKAGYSKGLTDPKAALERVRTRLVKQAKALAAAGLVATPTPSKKPAVSASKPRAGAQSGAAGNARQMTDAELRKSVLKEHGLLR